MLHMSFNSSRDTLLVQLSAIGESVSELRTELVELGGALIEAEQKRLAGKLRAIEARHAALLEALRKQSNNH